MVMKLVLTCKFFTPMQESTKMIWCIHANGVTNLYSWRSIPIRLRADSYIFVKKSKISLLHLSRLPILQAYYRKL